MKLTAKRRLPGLEEEAFTVGILYPIYAESPQEVEEILKEASVAEAVIEGLKNDRTPLGLLRKFAQNLLPYCLKLSRGEIEEVPVRAEQSKKNLLTKLCLEATCEAEKVVKLL